MKHLRQPNGWSCLATSFAMVLDTTVERIFEYTGHDGSAIAFPSLQSPNCRRGHTVYEMVQFSLSKGFAIAPFQPRYAHTSLQSNEQLEVLVNSQVVDELFAQCDIVLMGTMENGGGHAAAWSCKDRLVLDPNGFTYHRLHYTMNVELFLLCLPLKQPLWLSAKHENTLPKNELTS